MSVGSLITAARYNAIQARVANVLGVGQEQFGYGQTLTSIPLSVRSPVTDVEMQHLKTDIERAHVHQLGALTDLPLILNKEIITDSQYTAYETVSDTIVTNKNLIHPTQASLESKINSVRTTPWGTTITRTGLLHRVRVKFSSYDHMRHYFNAGGEIRFSANITNGTGFKTANWVNTLTSVGTVRFDYEKAYSENIPPRNVGFFQLLENQYKLIFVKGNSNIYQYTVDPYEDNYYSIEATIAEGLKDLIFKITFFDGASNQLDELVNGKLTSTVSQYRPTGNYVSIPSPSYENEVELA